MVVSQHATHHIRSHPAKANHSKLHVQISFSGLIQYDPGMQEATVSRPAQTPRPFDPGQPNVVGSRATLFVTPEFEDYVRVGGLASVSAALPRAMKSRADVRLLLPGYREVLSKLQSLEIVGSCPVLGEMPACAIGRTARSDGLQVYVVVCPELYDRDGTPYADEVGCDWRDNDLRFARLSSSSAFLAAGQVDPDWGADILHANDWPSVMAPA
jgi:Starch synthase catalytic domain